MSKEILVGISGFYCRKCGSTTAILIKNKDLIRCLGCLTLYCKSNDWEEWKGEIGDKPYHSLVYLGQ